MKLPARTQNLSWCRIREIPEKSPDDYWEFIDLAGERKVFDAAEIKSPLQGHGERRDEVLYLIPRRRFVLVYAFDRYEDFDGTEDSIKPPPPVA